MPETNNKRKFLFSMILSVYNTERYIDDAMDSLLNQTISFEDNVQVVFVNDGSTDNSAAICRRYEEEYPDNIVYVEKENGGLASAKNFGLNYVSGKFVSFMDPDDTLSPTTLEQVKDFFSKNGLFVDFAAIPLYYFEAKTGMHPRYEGFRNGKNYLVDLLREPNSFVFSSAASFYKSELFDSMRFDETLVIAEDFDLNMQLMQKNKRLGYVSAKDARYNYRIRSAGSSLIQSSAKTSAGLYSILKVFESHLPNNRELDDFEKEIIAYQCGAWVPQISEDSFTSLDEYTDVVNRFKAITHRLSPSFIWQRSHSIRTLAQRIALLNFSGYNYPSLIREWRITRDNGAVDILDARIVGKNVIVALRFNTWGYEDVEVLAYQNGKTYTPQERYDGTGPYDKQLGEINLDCTHIRIYHIPLRQGRINFVFKDANDPSFHKPSSVSVNKRSCFSLNNNVIGPITGNTMLTFAGRTLVVQKSTGRGWKSRLRSANLLRDQAGFSSYLRLLASATKKYLLINDRPEKGGDNGEALFRHIMEAPDCQHLREITYYVISENCPDYRRLKSTYGKHIAEANTLKHKLLFLNAAAIFSSHNARQFYCPFTDEENPYFSDLYGYKFIWLQHGITMNNICKAAQKYNVFDDLIITATHAEQSEFLQTHYFYNESNIALTGFARYDLLNDNSQNIITVAPTWRTWLSGEILSSGFHAPIEGFANSDYYAAFSECLTDSRLHSMLRNHKYRLNFVLHPGMSAYFDLFEEFSNDVINVIPQEQTNYSDIFSESKLFITDYSSTAFDFAYLKKPLIYYQFDEDKFFSMHYKKGYYDYRTDGFGPVCTTCNQLLDAISQCFDDNFEMQDPYLERVNDTFAYIDKNNCQRILNASLPIIFPKRYIGKAVNDSN